MTHTKKESFKMKNKYDLRKIKSLFNKKTTTDKYKGPSTKEDNRYSEDKTKKTSLSNQNSNENALYEEINFETYEDLEDLNTIDEADHSQSTNSDGLEKRVFREVRFIFFVIFIIYYFT